MFDDIIVKKKIRLFDTFPEGTKPNRKVVCPTCGVVIITVESDLGTEKSDSDWEMLDWDYECRQCTDKTLHCQGGCGTTVKLNSKKQVEMITWTCIKCSDKERNIYV